jgi:hypothetical protein
LTNSLFWNRVKNLSKGEQEGRIGPAWDVGTSRRKEDVGERVEEGEYGANIVYMCM